MEVLPSAESFKPGQHAKITVKLTDAEGKPFVGSTVLSIFDKSLEYISGGSNVGEHQGILLEVAAPTSAVSGNESRRIVRQPGAARAEVDGADLACLAVWLKQTPKKMAKHRWDKAAE